MRVLYTVLFALALPGILLRLYWRGIKAPAYRQRWQERLGVYGESSGKHVIWLHAVSVGEAEAAFPLVKRLQEQYPDQRLLLTSTTPTGSARILTVLGDTVEHVYLPYDLPWVIARFLATFQPQMAVFMEKELWPNLFAACQRQGIPLYIVNARLSARSAQAYKKIPALIKPALACTTLIAAQTEADRQCFVEIGAHPERVVTLGNIKFDVSIATETVAQGVLLKRQHFVSRFVWIVASTHKGEEAIFYRAYAQLKNLIPELLLLIVPRHPERFMEVGKLAEQQGLNVARRSRNESCEAATDVYLGDTMGELKMLYAASDVCFVGGSMVPVGGHNVLEPAALAVPVLFGPHMFNFQEIAADLLATHAAMQCRDGDAVVDALSNLYRNAGLRQTLAENAARFVKNNQGAVARLCNLLTIYRSGPYEV